ncbi:hypothetical protein, partial [Xanthomonas fragariae]|uniref:hypothetical protein n=3 Tax=Xanthomonas fragariae TaxID=48664 RepID=UPI001F4464B5
LNVCKMDNHPSCRRPHKLPAHTVKEQWEAASAPFPPTSSFPSKLAAHYSGLFLAVNTFIQRCLTPIRLPPEGFRRTQPAIVAGFVSLSTPREELLTLLHFHPLKRLSV